METRALIRRRSATPRAWYAAGLLVVLLAALLGAWFVSGWHDVRMRQAEARDAPHEAAEGRAVEIARELSAELEALIAREARRPYFHYQNLMHDPKASPGLGVSPSPLAQSSDDALVLGYFQIDGAGRVTTPTINDELPELSEPENLAANRAFRDQVAHDLAGELAPLPPPVQHAMRPPVAQKQPQVVELDPDVYVQNSQSNAIYWQQQVESTQKRSAPAPASKLPRASSSPASPVTITISPLEWQTHAFSGAPTLVAVRHVQTPDGSLVQGFVIDRNALGEALAAKAGDMIARIRVGAQSPDASSATGRAVDLAPGWQLVVSPNPRTLAEAATAAEAIARAFLIRFFGIGALALVAAGSVLLLVLRAEQLARERSQFAAAAAHELRTPLAGLQLYGDMLADGLGDPAKVRDYARRMSEEASRLGRVVSNVLGFSQLERGNLAVEPEVGSLGEALRELAERAEPALDRAGAVLELDVAPELRARFDRDALARIIGNLLDNAEKYARGAEDRTIRLAARERGDVVEIVVQDHGPGVRDRTQLFRPFSRGVTGDGPAGLGLGLALSRSLAEAMGGKLVYRASEGRGATFVLELPRA